MENKQTAVDWLMMQLPVFNRVYLYEKELYHQAKQMEKEQIISAYMVCDDCGTLEESEKYAEQYYNETYGK